MTISSFEAVIYTFQFVVPGYIIAEIVSAIMPQKKASEGEKLVQAIGYSVINLALWCWLFMLVQQHCSSAKPLFWIANALLTLLTGGFTGVIIGVVREKGIIRKLLGRLGIDMSHPIPTAWDYKFSDGKSYWVEVFLTDGKIVRGLYSDNSLSSSDSGYHDIYIERLYKYQDDGWKPIDRTAGIWINPDEIRYIKFYCLEDKVDEQKCK